MKFFCSVLCLTIVFASCQPPVDNAVNETFDKNCQTTLSFLEAFQNENLDHAAFYAENAVMLGTFFQGQDSMNLAQIIEGDKMMWSRYDFEMVTDSLNLLPGVSAATKKADGSVRFYSTWKISLPGTDSTATRSGLLKMYESLDFNNEGKIVYQQFYGDGTALFNYLESKE